MKISAVLITYNEEANIDGCLESVKWADEIVMVDSGSTDQTIAKAERYTSHIFKKDFINFADQKNTALSHATGDWIFFIDADERVTAKLAKEIQEKAESNKLAVYKVKRVTSFFGKLMRFSGTQDDYPIRLFPKEKVRFDQPVHEEIITALPVEKLDEVLLHHGTKDITHYRRKLDQYVSLELETMKLKGRRPSLFKVAFYPVAKFIQLYFIKLGILDGKIGLQYAVLSSYYDYLKHKRYLFSARNKF